jgi:hypothetical protein
MKAESVREQEPSPTTAGKLCGFSEGGRGPFDSAQGKLREGWV